MAQTQTQIEQEPTLAEEIAASLAEFGDEPFQAVIRTEGDADVVVNYLPADFQGLELMLAENERIEVLPASEILRRLTSK